MEAFNNAFASDVPIVTLPRRALFAPPPRVVRDLEWKPNFVKRRPLTAGMWCLSISTAGSPTSFTGCRTCVPCSASRPISRCSILPTRCSVRQAAILKSSSGDRYRPLPCWREDAGAGADYVRRAVYALGERLTISLSFGRSASAAGGGPFRAVVSVFIHTIKRIP